MSLNINKLFETTAVRNVVRSAVASAVGAAVAYGTTKWASLQTSNLAYLVPTFSTAYFGLVHLLEKKYPKFGWLLGLLPKSTPINFAPNVVPVAPVVPTPAPAAKPVVKIDAPRAIDLAKKTTVAKKAPAAKKAAPKKTGK